MGDDPSRRGASRRRIIRGVEDSLRRLNTDWIDLYQIHRPDPSTDIDETLGTLSDLVHQGKIRYFGHSTFPASHIVEAQWTAEHRGRERFRCEQPPYSILVRTIEQDVLPTCQRYGMGVIPYSPLAGGWLSGRYRTDADVQGRTPRPDRRRASTCPIPPTAQARGGRTAHPARGRGGQFANRDGDRVVLRDPAVTAAIIGPLTMAHLDSQLAAADVELSTDLLDRIDQINPPGVTINPADNGWVSPALEPAGRRR